MTLLLASRSATRRSMLEAAGVLFDVTETELDEEVVKGDLLTAGIAPAGVAEELARMKASSAKGVSSGLVLGSDQVLETENGLLLSKPGSRGEAFDQLHSLAGTRHKLHSAAAIVEDGTLVWSSLETVVLTMRQLSDEFLEDYLDEEFETIRWSVGGYRIEGRGVQLFDRIEGSHFAILGLPLLPLLAYLRERGVLAS